MACHGKLGSLTPSFADKASASPISINSSNTDAILLMGVWTHVLTQRKAVPSAELTVFLSDSHPFDQS